jgi:predicted DCC family thiol-disulfide oxidoreductase YuxK
MITSYILFIKEEDLQKIRDKICAIITKKFGAPVEVYFDGACQFCVRTTYFLKALDFFKRVNFVDFRKDKSVKQLPDWDSQRAEHEILLKTRQNNWLGGFDAFAWMSLRFPLLWILSPLPYFPGVKIIGRKIYSVISSKRNLILGKSCSVCINK